MATNYLSKYREFEKGKYGFILDIAIFATITYAFHLIFRYYASEIMAIPFVIASGEWLAYQTYIVSMWFNEHILFMDIIKLPSNTVTFTNGYSILVNSSCSGLKQFYQVFVLFVLFPGPWRHKLWFIPMGFVAMFATNVFRIIVLSVVMSWKPEHFEFVHTWVLRPFFYVVLFGLWVWWVEKFRRK